MSISIEWEMSAGRMLRGDYYPSELDSAGTLVVCHGFKGFKDWGFFPYIGHQLSQKLDVLIFNFSHNGVGESATDFTELDKFARNTYSRELEDLDFAICSLRSGAIPCEKQPKIDPLYILGHSRGAGVALIYAMDHPEEAAGVISWNGITDPDIFDTDVKEQMMSNGIGYIVNARTHQKMPLAKEILDDLQAQADRYNIVDRARDARFPIVLIQGTEDHSRLVEGSRRLIAARPDMEWIRIEGGNHSFNAVHPFQGAPAPLQEAVRVTEDWIMKQMSSQPS
ncbi:S9 family peptidase [Paenibacillus sp. J2TS4]|uniref:alpha/beta hydrolase family protein n=1 Tax=Paenibacillus sp. J2TS4 TaxID=2807194 RepID=UPI001B1BF2DC|nr:alpha/beta fold hydrolase [Paenibacillus sp. J2TS4]GIP36423.1 hypothetical protein J2TS4_56330 [Paenibacillus sp. J2TS4]